MRNAWIVAFVLVQAISASAQEPRASADGWMPLFNGKDLNGFYTFRPADGKNNDPQKVFKVENGVLRILDIADTTKPQENGYLATSNEYRNYRVRMEYKWGEKKFPVPRHENENLPRDSGLLYHIFGADKRWPQCVEFQIQEHDTGDVWLLWDNPRPTVMAGVATTQPAVRGQWQFQYGGAPTLINGQRLSHRAEYDSLTDWNSIELIVSEDEAVHIVNGHVSNIIKQMRDPASGKALTQGRLAIQAESNEIMYRNIEIKPLYSSSGGPSYKVLVFSKTAGFRHASIPDGITAIKGLAQQNNFQVDATEDANTFTDESLKQYKAIIFLSTTGDALNDVQQQAFQKYIQAGGGFVGIHAASDTEFDWPWFGKLVGAYFSAHPSGTPTATVQIEDPNHPSTSSLPIRWTRVDEWYNFKANPRADVHVLATLDETSYRGGTMNGDHPISWCHDFDGGRSWYTALGHTKESFSDPLFLMHLLGGIEYAAGRSQVAPAKAIVLFDGKNADQWCDAKGEAIAWGLHDGVLESKTRVGNIFTKQKFDDVQLHVEFKVPATVRPQTRNEITNEQSMGNSGIYLQGHYELQILDSFDHPLQDKNDAGAVYSIKDAEVNAALPAEIWQTYDIWFKAPRWDGDKKVSNARVTAYLNGKLVQQDVEIPNFTQSGTPEAPGPGPIMLQDHLNPVQFRNIWVKPL